MSVRSYLNNEIKPVFVDIWRLLAPFQRVFRNYLILLVLYQALQVVESFVMGGVILLHQQQVTWKVWSALLIGLIIYDDFFRMLDSRLDWSVIAKLQSPIYSFLKCRALKQFLDMDIPWHHQKNSGTLVGKIGEGVWKIHDLISKLCWEIVPTSFKVVLSLIPIFYLSPLAGLLSVLSFWLFFWLTFKSHLETQEYRKEIQDLLDIEWERGVQMVQSVETTAMFVQQTRLLAEYQALHDQMLSLRERETRTWIFVYNRWRGRVLSVARRLILGVWVWQLGQGTLSIAGLFYLSVLSEKLFSSFWRIGRLMDDVEQATESVRRMVDLMNQTATITDPATPVEVPTEELHIEFVDVSFAYNKTETNGHRALKDVTLSIPFGKVTAVVGHSGAGKTTLRRLIPRIDDIQAGQITIGGVDVRHLPLAELRRLFGFVPQGDEVYIFDDTVRRNITFGRPDASDDDLLEAARFACIHDFIVSLPQGYETRLGEHGHKLSGGQKQRLAAARAFLTRCAFLILDEPTASVDAETEFAMLQNMRSGLAGRTILISAHRLSTVRHADKIVVMDQGRIAEEGTHETLMALNGVYARLIQHQNIH